MRTIIPQGVRYGGVTSHESSYNDICPVFKTFNGEKPVFILNAEQTNVEGIVGSLNLLDHGHTYYTKHGGRLGDKSQAERKVNSRLKKRKMSVKKAKRGRKK